MFDQKQNNLNSFKLNSSNILVNSKISEISANHPSNVNEQLNKQMNEFNKQGFLKF